MPLVDLETARGHLRVLHTDDDSQISLYLAAAESAVLEYLDRPVVEVGTTLPLPEQEGYDATAMVVTFPIIAAILLVMSDLYENREPDPKLTGDAVLPKTVRMLLAPWRVWRKFEEDCDYVGYNAL